MARIRQWHTYVGLFIAPSVLFFAITGAVQLFNLHESHGDYRPPALIEKLSSIHKDQVFAFGDHHAPPQAQPKPADAPPSSTQGPDDGHGEDRPAVSTLALKWFFLLVAVGLCGSTALGLWMGLAQRGRRTVRWLVLVAGSVIPLALLLV